MSDEQTDTPTSALLYRLLLQNIFLKFHFIDSLQFSLVEGVIEHSFSYRVSQVKLDETKRLFQTENTPWGSET